MAAAYSTLSVSVYTYREGGGEFGDEGGVEGGDFGRRGGAVLLLLGGGEDEHVVVDDAEEEEGAGEVGGDGAGADLGHHGRPRRLHAPQLRRQRDAFPCYIYYSGVENAGSSGSKADASGESFDGESEIGCSCRPLQQRQVSRRALLEPQLHCCI
ncbi:Os06g0725250, partial [Oryza sativa Japonica Group]